MQQLDKLSIKTNIVNLSLFFIFFTLLTWFVSDQIFFWDTIQLGAKHGLFFYENNFSSILLPDNIDSGHIPTFGMYLAICWKIFGKSLLVSHFAILPFLLGIVWQAYILLKKYINPKYIYFALTLFLADATFLSQATLISPDVVLVFLFLLGLNAVLRNKKVLVSIACAGLVLISMRGMMVAFSLLILDIILNVKFDDFKSVFFQLVKKTIVYFPAFIVFTSYYLYHYYSKGWIAYHADSPWEQSFQLVDFSGFIFNTGILGWRILDFGRVFLWLFSGIITIKYFKNLIHDKKLIQILFIFIIVLICLSVSFVLYQGLSGHRYLLPVYLIFSLFTCYLVFEKLKVERLKYIIFSILLVGSLTGNLWIYPEKIAMGWDSTLAHLPYYHLRKQMLDYLNENKIKTGDVGCDFPNLSEQKYMELNDDLQKHHEKNLDTDKYVLYSNVYNGFSDNEIDRLKTDFILLKEYKQFGVFMRIYKRKI